MAVSLIGFAVMLVLSFARMPIAFAMIAVGFLGFAHVVNWSASLAMIAQVTYDTSLSYELTVVPLFILMGSFLTRAGLSAELYTASYAFLGHRRGGLAMATVVACGGFSAVCGSSLATAATMSRVAMPSMRRYGYADSLATGTIAAGGTLGILIPPSVILIIYGILTETDIGSLFIAGIIPGLIGVLGYMATVALVSWRHPERAPPGERVAWRQRFTALKGVIGILVIFVIVIGGLYLGVFTPTEAAGIGAAASFAFVVQRRRLSWNLLSDALAETARTTGTIFMVVIGASIFSNFVNLAGLPNDLADWVSAQDFSPLAVLLAILAIYLVLGCVLESLSMILLTVPVFYPLVVALDFGMPPSMVLIWFGILVVVVTEISLITPPVGLNVFVLKGILRDVPTGTIYAGLIPFIGADVVRLFLLVALPVLTLYLPGLMAR